MMKKLSLLLWSVAIMGLTTTAQAADEAAAKNPDNMLHMQLKDGTVTIEMMPDVAPLHVERIKMLTKEGFYDGVVFHRVIDGFMAQTGDPTGTGRGGSSYPDLKAEFSNTPYKRGTIGMARTMNPDSANSQFFICFTDDGCSFLTGQYTVWGQVSEGMELVDKIARGEPPATPDKIVKMSLANEAIASAATAAGGAPAMMEPAPAETAAAPEAAPAEEAAPEAAKPAEEHKDEHPAEGAH